VHPSQEVADRTHVPRAELEDAEPAARDVLEQ
jgi:hypothetical protein